MTTVAGAAVVVGVDGSSRSMAAVEVAAAEAARRHRPLRIVHALSWPALQLPLPPGLAEASPEAVPTQARAYLVEAVQRAGEVAPGVPTTTELLSGPPAAVLTRVSARAEMLVVGEHGQGGLLFGSVARHLASHSACPVLVVRGELRATGPVVAGVDGSARSADALELALEEAALRGTSLVALHAWTGTDRTELDDEPAASRGTRSGEEQEQRVLAEALAGAADRYPDVPVRRQVVRGHAGALLGEWSHLAQLVVVGDHGSGGLTGHLLGSVGRHLIFEADCPTMVVRSHARSRVG
ncbi:universal stress protein [Amorphoplanes nipponensis]|uniref:Universal stress protein n=1 Tax=Actinoplanes nipponensis TaxID=135950 RepID=A0A919JVP3_9ACTN|nr:universal stress protein [Actinoplanes nipponensis]GIE53859.1 universal stress protein [Actinoplanes nipponensis]